MAAWKQNMDLKILSNSDQEMASLDWGGSSKIVL